MRWISSEGGPLALVAREYLPAWRGAEGDDYERACAVDGYAGVIDVRGSQALILGDEPCQTSIYQSAALGLLIVRWQWAEDEESVQQAIEKLVAADFKNPEEEIEYRVDDESLALFDAVTPGDESAGLALELPVARYVVPTVCYVPDEQTSLIVHRFVAKS